MNTVIVAAHTYDPKHYGVPKYDNPESWNRPGGQAPTGVSAYRWLRKTSPDAAKLSPLAAWLVAHVPANVGGTMPSPCHELRVKCFNGKTVAEQNNWTPEQKKCWAPMGDGPAKIDDYLFPIIGAKQSDEDYWNAVADTMMVTGIIRIVIGGSEWVK